VVRRRLDDERGFALVLALAASVSLAILGTSIAYYTTSNSHQSNRSSASQRAYSLAEAGLNNALSILRCSTADAANPCLPAPTKLANDPTLFPSTPPGTPQMTLDGGTAVYSGVLTSNGTVISSGTCSSPCVWTLTSTGVTRADGLARSVSKTLTRSVTVNGINDGADGGSWSRFYQDSAASCLTIDNTTFVTNVGTRGDLCIRDGGGITGASTNVDVGGDVSIEGPNTASGPRAPTAATGTSWGTPSNVYTSNSSYTTYTVPTNGTSNNLDVTGFGFSIPTSAIIKGISVSVDRHGPASPSNSLRDNTLYLLKAGATSGSSKANTGSYWGTSDSTPSYGSSSDLWGTTWTAAQVNASNFGVRLSVKNYNTSTTSVASVDSISVTVTYTNDTNGIGASGSPVNEVNVGGTCTYNANAAHNPCTSADHVYAGTINSLPPASNPAIDMPQVDFNYWWANAKPGPKHFCTNANPGLAANFFDNDAASTSAPNKSILVNGEMAPSTSSYDCQYWENGQMVGQLKWNHVNHRMDIKGVIFVDGNFRFDEDGEIIHYYGRANLMSSRDDEIDALVCAGGATDASGNPTGNTYPTSCSANMSSWDQSQNMMVLMSQMPNEYDQGGTSCAGSPPSCYNGHLPAGFQGIMYSTSDCLIHQNFMDSGPVICNTISLPDEGVGMNPTFYTFPYTGNLTDGQKYSDVHTATHFELVVGDQSG
jgi:Tfp pilus assembly protein PilX